MLLPAVCQSNESKAAGEIRRQDALWVKAAATKSVRAWTAFYARGATVLPPNAPVCQTQAEIDASIAALLTLPNLKLTWKPTKIETSRSGDMGYAYGTYQLSMTGPDGKPVIDRGKNLEVWMRQRNGSWKCIADTWNSDLPADPLAAEWTLRYETYCKTISNVDYKEWAKYVAPDCVWVKSDGTIVGHDATLKEVAQLFKAKRISGGETVLAVIKNGDLHEVSYAEDWIVTFADRSTVRIKQKGTDVWKEIGGKWQIVKTIDGPSQTPSPSRSG